MLCAALAFQSGMGMFRKPSRLGAPLNWSQTPCTCTAWNPPPNIGLFSAMAELTCQAKTLPMKEPSAPAVSMVDSRLNHSSGARPTNATAITASSASALQRLRLVSTSQPATTAIAMKPPREPLPAIASATSTNPPRKPSRISR